MAVSARNANESELVPASSLLLLFLLSPPLLSPPASPPPPLLLLLVPRFFTTALLSRRRPAEMTKTGVLAHLNDGRGTTVATTVIHDHVDLRGATHYLVCGVRRRCIDQHTRASVRSCALMNRISIRRPIDRARKIVDLSKRRRSVNFADGVNR